MNSVSCGNGKLRQWLIDQIDSGKYPGLVWENDEKSIFRIPWKHAGKQDYNREEDAALFKVRLLGCLPFPLSLCLLSCFPALPSLFVISIFEKWETKPFNEGEEREREFVGPRKTQFCLSLTSLSLTFVCETGCQVTGTFYACAPPESQTPGIPIEPSIRSGEALALSDCRLHICLYYREILVKEVTTSSPEGCRISQGQSYEVSSLEQVIFPYPEDNGQRKNIEKLLSHLERGVILWMAPDGLYAKRLCQSRIYWDGPLALCSDRPNKLERDQTCKLFDTQQFLAELQAFAHHGRPLPRYQVALCFGEEFPDPQRQRKLITAHVTLKLADHSSRTLKASVSGCYLREGADGD
uniref:Interferon regulatory factor 4 n=1 Tax=Pavo cristatus TaxID=9049 RepID=A0A8C9FJN7_PAVCR